MTRQQLADYERVQSVEILKLWIECVPEYKGKSIGELPIRCAISDMEMVICDGVEAGRTKHEVSRAKEFLKKYAK